MTGRLHDWKNKVVNAVATRVGLLSEPLGFYTDGTLTIEDFIIAGDHIVGDSGGNGDWMWVGGKENLAKAPNGWPSDCADKIYLEGRLRVVRKLPPVPKSWQKDENDFIIVPQTSHPPSGGSELVEAPPDDNDDDSEEEAEKILIIRVSYDCYYHTPHFYVSGQLRTGAQTRELDCDELMLEVAHPYRFNTVTPADFHYAISGGQAGQASKMLSIHPCGQKLMMTSVVQNWVGEGYIPPSAARPTAECRKHLALLLIIKALETVLPTINFGVEVRVPLPRDFVFQ